MKKAAILGTALAALTATAAVTPAWAQHAFHPLASPSTCVEGDASASARWVPDPNHFHPVLDLQANGGEVGCAVRPDFPAESEAFAGAFVHGLRGFPIGNFSFDYRTDYCDGLGEDQFFFVEVFDASQNQMFFQECSDFPVTGANNTWHHEQFNRGSMNFPPDDTFGTIYIGIFNGGEEVSGDAQVKNIFVDNAAAVPVFEQAVTFCPELPK